MKELRPCDWNVQPEKASWAREEEFTLVNCGPTRLRTGVSS